MMQKQPWDIRSDDSRNEDSLITFIIFCEDEVSEPTYFRTFNSGNVKVNEIPGQRNKKLQLDKTISTCTDMGLVHFYDGGHKVDEKIAITTGTNAGLRVAWSNDCFELWVLLHFEDICPSLSYHREHLYNRLTDIFKNLKGTIQELTKSFNIPDSITRDRLNARRILRYTCFLFKGSQQAK